MKTGFSESTNKYLEARCQKLYNREKIGSLFLTKFILLNVAEFSRSNDQIYGMRVINSQQRHALSDVVMFKSIASTYEDVLAMLPLTKIGSSVLHKFFNDVINAITTIGYDVVISLADGPSSNVLMVPPQMSSSIKRSNVLIIPLQ